MARATFVKAAQKDNSAVKKGESYYWWKFRFGGKHYSKTRPKSSQLTQSAFLGTVYAIVESIEDTEPSSFKNGSDMQSFIESTKDDIASLRDETQDSLDNMPEHLQESSSSGELLTERIELLEEWETNIDGIDEPYDETEDEELQGIWEEFSSFTYEGS